MALRLQDYAKVVGAVLQVELQLALGWLAARFRLLGEQHLALRTLNQWCLRLGVPMMSIYLLGIKTGLRQIELLLALAALLIWNFAGAGMCAGYTMWTKGTPAAFANLVSCVCVNSTAIIGLVLLQSIFGQAGSSLSQLGAVLLFLFQCPMVELAYKHHTPAAGQGSKFPHESRYCYWTNEPPAILPLYSHLAAKGEPCEDSAKGSHEAALLLSTSPPQAGGGLSPPGGATKATGFILRPLQQSRTHLWHALLHVFHNHYVAAFGHFVCSPFVWSSLVGVVLSLSGLGAYFNSTNPHFVPWLGFVEQMMAWNVQATLALLVFSNGMWMQGCHILTTQSSEHMLPAMLLLTCKLVASPLLMLGICKLLRLGDNTSMGLVVLSTMPVAFVAYALGERYGGHITRLTIVMNLGILLLLPYQVGLFALVDRSSVLHVYLA